MLSQPLRGHTDPSQLGTKVKNTETCAFFIFAPCLISLMGEISLVISWYICPFGLLVCSFRTPVIALLYMHADAHSQMS